MYNKNFSGFISTKRKEKPRETGLTIIIDHGLGIGTQRDILETSSEYIDLAKIMVGIPALLPQNILKRKIDVYHENNIMVFPGGQFLEYAFEHNKIHEYFDAVKRAGFELIEVSDNLINLLPDEKSNLIKIAIDEYEFKVLGETGTKKVVSDYKKLIEDIKNCIDNGAWKVMFEASELFENGRFRTSLVEKIISEIPLDRLIFELPGGWISGITISHIYSLGVWLIEKFGAEVNIGNVDPFEVLCLEAERNNLGTHMRF